MVEHDTCATRTVNGQVVGYRWHYQDVMVKEFKGVLTEPDSLVSAS
jgi:hypothetical protein